jgi:iron(III) transport system permease protein
MIGLPLLNVIIRACFAVEQVDGKPVPGYSLDQLGRVVWRSLTGYRNEFWWSFAIGASSSSLLMAAGTVLIWKARSSTLASLLVGITWVTSCTIPGPLIGTLVGSLFQNLDGPLFQYLYNRTIAGPVLANVIFCWPFPPLIIWFIFRNTASDVLDSARLDGAGEWQIFWRFGILDHFPKLFGCWLVTLAICVGELSASQLVLPPGMDTLPRLMLGLLHAGVDEMTAGITIILIAVIGLISVGGWKMIQWSFGRELK